LEALAKALDPYPKWGTDLNLYKEALQAMAMMELNPGKSYNCGPYALVSVAEARPDLHVDPTILLAANATADVGFSVKQLVDLANQAGLNMIAARRPVGTTIPFPAVVHWKSGHYAAVLDKRMGEYQIKDPTFVTDFWMSQAALDDESSGAFLIFANSLPAGWTTISDDEAAQIFGKGMPTGASTSNQAPSASGSACGMAVAGYNLFDASVLVTDTPLHYQPPLGPAVDFTFTFYENELAGQTPIGG
jgi:hypothetical protein